MSRLRLFPSLLLLLVPVALPAQQPETGAAGDLGQRAREVVERSGVQPAVESIAAATAPELREALDQVAVTLAALVKRIASDPELHRSAVSAAGGLVGVAQDAIEEQSTAVQEALRKLAERLESMPPPALSVPGPG